MTSSKPYLIRAIYDWLIDNELTPYIVVDVTTDEPSMQVPQEHVDNGRIILNISPKACRGLHLENDRIIFSARFSGKPTQIRVPISAVLAIYARENGRGMVFNDDDESPTDPAAGKEKPNLRIVK